MQVQWAVKGIPTTNEAGPIVKEYFDRLLLAKLGYRFNSNELEQWQVDAFNLIEATKKKIADRDAKKNKLRKR
jgi:hypothetical protein